jgi:hypothetical protein
MFLVIGVLGVNSFTQDPTKVAPESYKLQLENDWVRVLRVHYRARAKVVNHDHSAWPAGYVYLNDAGPVQFEHEGWDDPVLRRPPVKAKAFRLSRTNYQNEHHMVNNISNTDSHFLRIEFKTMHQGRDLAHLRVAPEVYDRTKRFSKVHFDNPHVKVTRLATPKNSELSVASDKVPVLVVLLAPEGKRSTGDTIWLQPGEITTLQAGASELEVLLFEIKAAPRGR